MISIRQTVPLSGGTVVLKAWGTAVQDAYLLDILTLTATLGAMRDDWQEFTRGDVEEAVWASFWRLVNASLEENSTLPKKMSWLDRWTLLLISS